MARQRLFNVKWGCHFIYTLYGRGFNYSLLSPHFLLLKHFGIPKKLFGLRCVKDLVFHAIFEFKVPET